LPGKERGTKSVLNCLLLMGKKRNQRGLGKKRRLSKGGGKESRLSHDDEKAKSPRLGSKEGKTAKESPGRPNKVCTPATLRLRGDREVPKN